MSLEHSSAPTRGTWTPHVRTEYVSETFYSFFFGGGNPGAQRGPFSLLSKLLRGLIAPCGYGGDMGGYIEPGLPRGDPPRTPPYV